MLAEAGWNVAAQTHLFFCHFIFLSTQYVAARRFDGRELLLVAGLARVGCCCLLEQVGTTAGREGRS